MTYTLTKQFRFEAAGVLQSGDIYVPIILTRESYFCHRGAGVQWTLLARLVGRGKNHSMRILVQESEGDRLQRDLPAGRY